MEDERCLSAKRGRSMRLFLEAGRADENGFVSSSGPDDNDDALDIGGECSALYDGCMLETYSTGTGCAETATVEIRSDIVCVYFCCPAKPSCDYTLVRASICRDVG